jgi:hypothetical protein
MGKNKKYVLAVIVVLIAAGAAVYYFYLMPPSPEETSESRIRQRSAAEREQQEAWESEIEPIEVELDKSDELVRKLVGELSSHPGLARWLVTDDLIRKFVSIVDVIATGGNPTRDMKSIKLTGDFQVGEEEGRTFMDPKSCLRYNRIADIIASLDAEGSVKLYRQLRLPIRLAYRELGYPEEDFNETLKKAVLELLETPIVDHRIYLERAVITYTFADPELESLNPAQKNLIRMGPDNMRKIQAKLREIAQALGIQLPE